MILYIKKKIGKETYQFSVEGKNLHECLMNGKKLSFHDLAKCGLCSSSNLELDAYFTKKKKLEYTLVRCKDCKGYLNFGKQTEDKDVFYFRTIETGKMNENGKPIKKLDWKNWKDFQAEMDEEKGIF